MNPHNASPREPDEQETLTEELTEYLGLVDQTITRWVTDDELESRLANIKRLGQPNESVELSRRPRAMDTVQRFARSPLLRSIARTSEDPPGPPLPSAMPSHVLTSEAEGSHWCTFPTKRRVVIAVHTVAAAMRLKDLAGLLDEDPEIGLTYTAVPDRLGDGVESLLQKWEVKRLAWDDATNSGYDLAIGASLHRLGDLRAHRTFAIAHGSGYNKRWPSWAWGRSDEKRPTYGLDRESLLDKARRPVVDALNLSHVDQWETLKRQCPEATSAAMVGGDPSFDRLLVSLPSRRLYRDALGVRDGQTLVAVTSTWGQASLLSRHPDLLLRLLNELPANHKVILTTHPAVWFEHGPRRIRTLLREACGAGLDVIDAGEDWQGLLAAADFLVGDHTSVSVYGAASGLPFLLSHFPDDDIDGESVMAELARLSPRLDDTISLPRQLEAAAEAQPMQRKVAGERVSSVPARSATVLRKKFYELLELPEPETEPRVERVLPPKLMRTDSVSW
jgi:hypothetical protein